MSRYWVGLVAVLVASGVTAFAADAPAGRLNAQDFGASGSKFETAAETAAGSKQIVVKDVGDFKVGQGVMVSKCNVRITKQQLWGPRGVVAMGRRLDGKAEIRGYDGSQGEWMVLVLDVAKGSKSFRWSEDLARTWQPDRPITGDWQPIRDGIEVRFNKFEWEKGYTVVFGCRCQLVTVIEKIEGNTITLRDAPTRTAKDAELRHCDDAALQSAINQAIKEKRNLYVPVGHYRLSRGLRVSKPEGLTIEGENAVHTILDISEGNGACVHFVRGTEVTLRNFTMVGHSGFDRRDQCGHIRMKGSSYFWGFGAKNCNATTISGTERVLIENCHGRRMASECFVSGCRSRSALKKPYTTYTKTTTYLRCSAIDCGRNAFNDVTSGPENTSVLYCRIVDVGGCSWEGASRFVKFTGNYVRNSGTVAIGNLGTYNRDESFPQLGAGQHIVANNVFESNVPYGRCAIRSAVGSTQVIVANNLFVNFGSSAVEASGRCDPTHYASANTTITGNIFDMTEIGDKPVTRTAVDVSASDTIVSDNQIYVRGAPDPTVTAIKLTEPAQNVTVHDNLIRNCGTGIRTTRATSRVGKVFDPATFALQYGTVPLDQLSSQGCRGWRLVWLAAGRPSGTSLLDGVIDADDPKTLRFRLREPRETKAGDLFETVCPSANWHIHDNTITACLRPVILGSYGSRTSVLKDNLISRGRATGVKAAVEVRGSFRFIGNHIIGFDEPSSAALAIYPDRLGRPCSGLYRDNTFERCANVVTETHKGLWHASRAGGNIFIDCGRAPKQHAGVRPRSKIAAIQVEPPQRPTLPAPKFVHPPVVDGVVAEWPWNDADRVVPIAQTPMGDPIGQSVGYVCAGRDETALCLAVRVLVPPGANVRGGADFASCDGVEVSFRNPGAKAPRPIFVLWGSTDGTFACLPNGGASPAQIAKVEAQLGYAARVGEREWTCEWRIPFAAVELDAAAAKRLSFNVGVHLTAEKLWAGWVGTRGAFYEVGNAGELVFTK